MRDEVLIDICTRDDMFITKIYHSLPIRLSIIDSLTHQSGILIRYWQGYIEYVMHGTYYSYPFISYIQSAQGDMA